MDKKNLVVIEKSANDDVVAELEELLASAKRGELLDFCIVGGMAGGMVITSFVTSNLQAQIGQVSFLLHTLCARQRESKK